MSVEYLTDSIRDVSLENTINDLKQHYDFAPILNNIYYMDGYNYILLHLDQCF